MKIEVRVVPRAKRQDVSVEGRALKVRLTAPPVEGKANEELISLLAETFGVRKSEVKILKGDTGRVKIVSLPVDESALVPLGRSKNS